MFSMRKAYLRNMRKKSVAIIGSGPAALMLAATLQQDKFEITIYERNAAPGRKFLVAGDGGFNLTHAESMDKFISRYSPPNYLEEALRSFDNVQLQKWLHAIGIETFVGSSNRVFPVKEIKPIQVLNAIVEYVKSKQVLFKYKCEWKGWNENNQLLFVHDNQMLTVSADIVVFALGGGSWKITGSDGSWTNYFLRKEIEVIPFQPSNCAFQVNWTKEFISQAEGKPLKNITVHCGTIEKAGEIVITKFGLEGGAAYAMSTAIRKQLTATGIATMFIDLKPTLHDDTILFKLKERGKQSITDVLLQHLKLNSLQIALMKSVINKEAFLQPEILAKTIKQCPIEITGMAPIDDAISTVGGIALHETDPSFQLNKLPQHYVIGEMLDWDAPTGGYLLQGCFSMGHFCAQNINKQLLNN